MQRPSGAAWAALGRDAVHLRTSSNALPSGPISPLMAGQSGSAFFSQSQHADGAERPPSSSGSETVVENTPALVSARGPGSTNLRALSGSSPLPLAEASKYASSPALLGPPAVHAGSAPPAVWRKVLYEKQPFDDNYVDAAFMQQLRTNTHLRALDFREIMRATFAILQQLNLVVLFIVMYAMALQGVLTPAVLLAIDAGLLVLALIGYVAITADGFGLATLFEPTKKTLVVTGVLLLLGPVFHTLTRSYSDDTIWALSILLGFIHVVCADYDYLNARSAAYTHNLSMNAAIVAVALLASRVANPVTAAAVIGVGILVFTLSPILRHHIRRASVEAHEWSSMTLCGIAIGCLVQLHPVLAAVFIVVAAVLVFAMPQFFVRVQSGQYKTQIQGPWDEAKPQNSAAAAEWANAGLLS